MKGKHIRDLCFDLVTFWVQVYEIPIWLMNKEVAEGICWGISEVCSSKKSKMEGGDFMRVQVNIDVSKPLSQGSKISLDNGKDMWVSFKYERLSNICYWCGCLTQSDKDCNLWFNSEGTLKVESR